MDSLSTLNDLIFPRKAALQHLHCEGAEEEQEERIELHLASLEREELKGAL